MNIHAQMLKCFCVFYFYEKKNFQRLFYLLEFLGFILYTRFLECSSFYSLDITNISISLRPI